MWGSENWSEMIWGGAVAVPLLGPLGFVAMAICFMVGGAIMQSRLRSQSVALLAATVLLVGPLVALAVTLPHSFTNGTIADADQVNANFDTLTTELNGLDLTIRDYINANCRLYVGWRDSCDGCTLPPSKWGFVNQASCANGAGADNTCQSSILGGESVQTFGLNTDGIVDGTDKFYFGIKCL